MSDKFGKKTKDVIQNAKVGAFGLPQTVVVRTKAGVSDLISWVGLFEAINDEKLEEIPDRVLSASLDCFLDEAIEVVAQRGCMSKYFPQKTEITFAIGLPLPGDARNVMLKNWEDFNIIGSTGRVLYNERTLADALEKGVDPLAWVLQLVVDDICDEGAMLSEDWYCARILLQYFSEPELSLDSAFLIGTLYRELRVKMDFEDDLSKHYSKLESDQADRQKGTDGTRSKAKELRAYCFDLFVKMVAEQGVRLSMASADIQAKELQKRALSERPNDFLRKGQPYRYEWFLRHIIEDRKPDIVQALSKLEEIRKR